MMTGIGMPSSQSRIPRPIVSSGLAKSQIQRTRAGRRRCMQGEGASAQR